MLIQPIDVFVGVWLLLALLSAVYVGVDQFRNNPEPAVMKWGFILVTLYMGPIGLLLYVMADKEPAPGTHEDLGFHESWNGKRRQAGSVSVLHWSSSEPC